MPSGTVAFAAAQSAQGTAAKAIPKGTATIVTARHRFRKLPIVSGQDTGLGPVSDVFDPGGANNAAWQVALGGGTSPDTSNGRLFHLTLDPSIGSKGGTMMAFGCDYGNANYPGAILIANKAQSRGLTIDQQSTVTDTQAYGLNVSQQSTAAPAAFFGQFVAGAAAAVRIAGHSAPSTTDKTFEIFTRGAESMSSNADSGLVTFQKGVFVAGDSTFKARTDGSVALKAYGFSATQTSDIVQIETRAGGTLKARVLPTGQFLHRMTVAPADASLVASEGGWWLDDTPGATKVKFKAKDSGGTVRTGEIALT